MRHYVFTYYESLDVSPEEREFFIQKHLGHSKFINENIYQCPPAVRLMETAGKALLTLDSYEGELSFNFTYSIDVLTYHNSINP